MRLYKFLRTSPRMTPLNVKRLSLIAPLPKSITKHPDTWLPFMRSLEQCIENQTIIQDIRDIKAPIDIFYGTLDQVVVGHNVRQLSKLRDVTIHTFRGNHSIGRVYAHIVAQTLID
jgi:surfactin synthase thioesterase subunit